MNKAYISVIIPTRNRPQRLLCCLNSLLRQDFSEAYEIIIVDDGSQEACVRECREIIAHAGCKNVKYLITPASGPGAARIFGGMRAEGDILAFIDDDCMALPDWLSNISQAFRGDNDLSMMGGPLILQFSENSPWKILNEYFKLVANGEKSHYFSKYEFSPFNTLVTANMAVRKSDYMKDALPQKYSYLGDDTGLFYAFLKARKKIYFDSRVQVFHLYTEKLLELLIRKCYRYGKVDVMMYHDFFHGNLTLDLRPLYGGRRMGNLHWANLPCTVYIGFDYIKLLLCILIFSLAYPCVIYFMILIACAIGLGLSLSGKRYLAPLIFFKTLAGFFVLLGRLRYCLKYRTICI